VLLRRHEIGVRMAIGADGREVVRLMLGHAFRLVLGGGAIGLALALIVAFTLRAMFVGTITPLDPVVLLSPLGLLAIVALGVAIPAYRAAKVDPVRVLAD
jgi:ABC-type antimicrobial peptide transport system permease subunit